MLKDNDCRICKCIKIANIGTQFILGNHYKYGTFEDNTGILYYNLYIDTIKKSYTIDFFERHFVDVNELRDESISKILE